MNNENLSWGRLERLRRGLLMPIGSAVFDASRPEEVRGTLVFVGPSMARVKVGRRYRQVNTHHLRKVKRARQ